MAQWIAHLTSDQKVAGLSPAWVNFFFCHISSNKQNLNWIYIWISGIMSFFYTLYHWYIPQSDLWIVLISEVWPSGVMDSASEFGSEGCRFKSCLGWFFCFIASNNQNLNWIYILISGLMTYCYTLYHWFIPPSVSWVSFIHSTINIFLQMIYE